VVVVGWVVSSKKRRTNYNLIVNYNIMNLDLETTIKNKLADPSNNFTPECIEDIQITLQYVKLIETVSVPLIAELNNVIKHGGLGVSDIPQIIFIITNIYTNLPSNIVSLDLSNNDNLFILVKFYVDCIIESNLFATSDTNKEYVEKTVNYSLELLKLNLNNIERATTECSSCFMINFCSFFSKKK
jgi:hypothetical protein